MSGGIPARRVDISVLLATRDRARILEHTLQSFRDQQLQGRSWEVVVIDNGSSDDTPAVLQRAAAELPLVAQSEPLQGKNRALNKGLELVRGALVVFTDDDVVADSRWILELHAAAKRWPDAAIFGGTIKPIYPPGTPSWLREHDFARQAFGQFTPGLPEGVLPDHLLPYGGNFAVRQSAIAGQRFGENLGPQAGDYVMGGEHDFIMRLRRRGAVAVFAPSAVVGHLVQPHQTDLAWLYGRSFRLGRGDARRAADNTLPQLAGVPRFLWRLLVVSAVQFARSSFAGERARFEAGIRYHRARGQLHEFRRLARERCEHSAGRWEGSPS